MIRLVVSLSVLTATVGAAEQRARDLRIAEATKRIEYVDRNADWFGDLESASVYRTALQWIEPLDREDIDWLKERCADGFCHNLWQAADDAIEERRYLRSQIHIGKLREPICEPDWTIRF